MATMFVPSLKPLAKALYDINNLRHLATFQSAFHAYASGQLLTAAALTFLVSLGVVVRELLIVRQAIAINVLPARIHRLASSQVSAQSHSGAAMCESMEILLKEGQARAMSPRRRRELRRVHEAVP